MGLNQCVMVWEPKCTYLVYQEKQGTLKLSCSVKSSYLMLRARQPADTELLRAAAAGPWLLCLPAMMAYWTSKNEHRLWIRKAGVLLSIRKCPSSISKVLDHVLTHRFSLALIQTLGEFSRGCTALRGPKALTAAVKWPTRSIQARCMHQRPYTSL